MLSVLEVARKPHLITNASEKAGTVYDDQKYR